jgi:FtsP/CotA-like multicopper oxidase with cupredoxin domain
MAGRAADRTIPVMLMGGMGSFQWGIVGGRRGERVHIVMQNHGMMAHPVHLHGHCFPVIGINSMPVSGAVRDTVHVPPMTIAFDADHPGKWAFHCYDRIA